MKLVHRGGRSLSAVGTRRHWTGSGLQHTSTCSWSPQLPSLREWDPPAVLGAWHCRLSVALQKGNAACLLQAGKLRGAADFAGETGWEADIDDLLRDAAAAAAAGGRDW